MSTRGEILVVDDEKDMSEYLARLLSDEGYAVRTASNGEEALSLARDNEPDVVLSDIRMPGMDGIELLGSLKQEHPHLVVIMMTAYGTLDSAIEAMRFGAYDYVNKPFEIQEIIMAIERALDRHRLAHENRVLHNTLEKSYTFEDIVSRNNRMQQVFDTVRKVGDTASSILIRGETGTGKELVARAIHSLSSRRDNAFVPVDCAALSETLLESELFGHVKGSFTGAAADKKGLFEAAHQGTLFLDEIGHMPPGTQTRLLRVLQDGELRRVGDESPRRVDVRLISATNEDIEQAVTDGVFREDLYYRINVVPVLIPPLRERMEDLDILVKHFIRKYNSLEGKMLRGVSGDVMDVLTSYAWPGNVRELENLIHRLVVTAGGGEITRDDLPNQFSKPGPAGPLIPDSRGFSEARKQVMDGFETGFLTEALKRNSGNVSRCAEEMGLDRRNLHKKLKKHGIDPSEYRQRGQS